MYFFPFKLKELVDKINFQKFSTKRSTLDSAGQ